MNVCLFVLYAPRHSTCQRGHTWQELFFHSGEGQSESAVDFRENIVLRVCTGGEFEYDLYAPRNYAN